MLKFIFKRTNELSDEEIRQICQLFYAVYNKEKPIDKYLKQFGQTIFGYSYHGLMVDEGKIVGCYAAIPMEYTYFGENQVFALSVDTMISKSYRGNLANLRKMANLVYEELVKDGIPFIYGFPNKNFYLVKKRVLGWVDIGRLDYYILPIRVSALIKSFKILDIISMLFSKLLVLLSKIVPVGKETDGFFIEKVNDNKFLSYRYDNGYRIIKSVNNSLFVYKIDHEEGLRVAYLLDVYPMNKKALAYSVETIFCNDKNDIDLIGYLGKLHFRPISLLKVPKRMESKAVRMSGKILINSRIDNRIYNIDNWNVNLSNFDVR